MHCENHTKYTSKLYVKMYFLNVTGGIDRAGSGYGQMAGTCQCGNEPSCSTKLGEFFIKEIKYVSTTK